jgi:hypothetical protein
MTVDWVSINVPETTVEVPDEIENASSWLLSCQHPSRSGIAGVDAPLPPIGLVKSGTAIVPATITATSEKRWSAERTRF